MESEIPHPKGQAARSTTRVANHELKVEPFPDWLNELESRRVKDYTDVNESEKMMMLLWNVHVTRCNVTGDVQIPWACRRFVELHGGDIAKRNLYRNFCLHITNLYDFGLLSMEDVRGVIDLYHSQRKAPTQPMEVSGDGDVVKTLRQNKRKFSESASTTRSSSERSPLKRIWNLKETCSVVLDDCSASPVGAQARELSPSFASKSDVNPPIRSPFDSKYPKKSKREKFPSYD